MEAVIVKAWLSSAKIVRTSGCFEFDTTTYNSPACGASSWTNTLEVGCPDWHNVDTRFQCKLAVAGRSSVSRVQCMGYVYLQLHVARVELAR
jgi:hypothetical protein